MHFKLLIILLGLALSSTCISQSNIYLTDGTAIQADSIKIFKSSVTYFIYNHNSLNSKSIQKSMIDSIATQSQKTAIFTNNQTSSSKTAESIEQNSKIDQVHLRIKKGAFSTKYYTQNDEISAQEFNEILSTNRVAHQLYNKGNGQVNIGNVIGYPSGFLLGYQLGNAIRGQGVNKTVLFGALVAGVISISITSKGSKNIAKALNDFNSSEQSAFGLSLGAGGAQLTYTF